MPKYLYGSFWCNMDMGWSLKLMFLVCKKVMNFCGVNLD